MVKTPDSGDWDVEDCGNMSLVSRTQSTERDVAWYHTEHLYSNSLSLQSNINTVAIQKED